MGRELRRKTEKSQRKHIKKDEIQKIREETRIKTVDYSINSLLTCFALAEHRQHKFGIGRVMKTLEYIEKLMEQINNDEKTMEDFKQDLEKEIGLVIR